MQEMMKFRRHRGGLEESMATQVEMVCSHQALTDRIAEDLKSWRVVRPQDIRVRYYCYDKRISQEVYSVVVDGYGVYGYTDRDVSDIKRRVTVPVDTPVDLREEVGPKKLVDRYPSVEAVVMETKVGRQKVYFRTSHVRCNNFMKSTEPNEILLRFTPDFIFDAETRDANGDPIDALALLRAEKMEAAIRVTITGSARTHEHIVLVQASPIKLVSLKDGGGYLDFQAMPELETIKTIFDEMQVVEVVLSVPVWDKPNLSGLTSPEVKEDVVLQDCPLPELLEWISKKSAEMKTPELWGSADGGDMTLTDEADHSYQYLITHHEAADQSATAPTLYRVTKT